MGFFKKLFGQWLPGQNAAYEPRPPSPHLAADTGDSSDNILERVRMGAAVPPFLGSIRPPSWTYEPPYERMPWGFIKSIW